MKVEHHRAPVEFRPIHLNITLQSKKDLDALYDAVSAHVEGGCRTLGPLFDKLYYWGKEVERNG